MIRPDGGLAGKGLRRLVDAANNAGYDDARFDLPAGVPSRLHSCHKEIPMSQIPAQTVFIGAQLPMLLRVRFIIAVAFAVLFAGPISEWALGVDKTSLVPPVLLPDGQEFKTWETKPAFSRTYYVAQSHPNASDNNPGTEALPWKTINRAAQALQPGERVVVAAGTYRERVRPARGGTGPERMISYEAAPGANVIISGSVVLEPNWTPLPADGKGSDSKLWSIKLPAQLFTDENPFALVNYRDERFDKAIPGAVDPKTNPANLLRSGLVFIDGRRIRQVGNKEELAIAKDAFWVDRDGLSICLNPPEGKDPNRMTVEATVRGMVFVPAIFGLGYIRVSGFTIEHSGNRFPRPQEGAISTLRGHHWLIEDNTVRQCNAIGVDIGDQFGYRGPNLAEGGQHIVRRNTVADCGIGGIEGKCIEHTLIEENRISRCGWQHVETGWETGGIKVHCAVSTLIRKNLVQDTIDAAGIWMDYSNRNSRCTQNVVIRTKTQMGGIFMEASQAPNLVDHNIIWGSTGNGIYQHDCDELVIAHNLIAHCADAGIRMRICAGRDVGGRLSTAKRNKILNNIIADTEQMLAISDPDNVCDGNLFGASREPFDLSKWREKHGWDRNSAVADIEAALDARTICLNWSVTGSIPECHRLDWMAFDFQGRPHSGQSVPPGPFATIPTIPAKVSLVGEPAHHAQD
jgi:alpha-L-arabinofuranosidase